MLAIQHNSWSQTRGFALEHIPIFDQNLLNDLSCKKFQVTLQFRILSTGNETDCKKHAGIFSQATSLHYPPCSTMTIDVETGEFVNGGIEFLIFDAIAKKLK